MMTEVRRKQRYNSHNETYTNDGVLNEIVFQKCEKAKG